MTKQEFEQLTGLVTNDNQFEVINGMYMCSMNQSKQEFCKMFMEMKLIKHVDNQLEKVSGLEEKLNAAKRICAKFEELETNYTSFVKWVAVQSHISAENIASECSKKLGIYTYFRTLQENDCYPLKSDINIVVNSLGNADQQ